MSDDKSTGLIRMEEGMDSGVIARWIPMIVVSTALTGFVGLAWYAYHVGTQSINSDELLVVEADASPMKEKPEDPGGMQFPNQDKIIFETFSGDTNEPPKVERILPAPEEPMKASAESDTTTWVNGKIHGQENTAEKPVTAEKNQEPKVEVKEEFVLEAAVDKQDENKKEQSETIASFKQEKEAPVKDEPKKPDAAIENVVKINKSAGNIKAQLGAYGSEKEAKAAWVSMLKKYSSELSGKSYTIVKADLGAKGTFYRLRVTGFADSATAKSFCGTLSAKGQACIPVAQ